MCHIFSFCIFYSVFFFSSRRRHTRCALVTGVQTCALPICTIGRTWPIAEPDALAEIEAKVATLPSDMSKAFGPRDKWTALKAAPLGIAGADREIGRASCRESVCQYV